VMERPARVESRSARHDERAGAEEATDFYQLQDEKRKRKLTGKSVRLVK
jgi:hypothetical protein